jgi:c-di-GMP phosphodiesterase
MPEQSILLARQPIYDASLNVVAFELLYRSISPDAAVVRDGDEASSRVLLNAFGAAGIMSITEGKPAFINFTEHLVINPPPLDPEHLIVEILEDIRVTPALLEGVRRLRSDGFRIALDDFQHHPSLEPLVELADIIKLDVLELGEQKLRSEVRQLRNYPLRLLAEKIETWEMYNECVDLGFSYFQGYFLARPQLMRGRVLDVARHAVLALMAKLADPESEASELAATISMDPVLSFNLIKMVNSPMYRRARRIESLRDAVSLLGMDRIRSWCMLLMMAKMEGKPRELSRIAMVRARFCELIGSIGSASLGPRCFTLGLMSTIDAFMDQELGSLLGEMSLGAPMRAALLRRDGELGMLLLTVMSFETGSWDKVPWQQLASLGIDQSVAEKAYLDSLLWADSMLDAWA